MRSQAGFNLLELIVVMLIAAILLGSTVVFLSEGPVLRTTAREVVSSIRHARSLAMLQQRDVLWSLDWQARKFWIQGQGKPRIFDDSVTAKITTAKIETGGAKVGHIRFFADGSATGGTVDLASRGENYTINVEWISGRVSLQ